MKTQHLVFTLLLLFLSLLDGALGAGIRADGNVVATNGSCSYATYGVGTPSVVCRSRRGKPRGQASRLPGYLPSDHSDSRRAAEMNISWSTLTATYTTTSIKVIPPVNYTKTYTERSTELTSTTLDMTSATQTIVEIAGYSTIDTYTTTFLEPPSSSTYSVIQMVTTTSSELVVPSVDTLTLTGTLPGALTSDSLLKRVPERELTAEAMNTLSSPLSGSSKSSEQVEPFSDDTEASSSTTSSVLVFTVTNTYSVTPTSEHTHKTVSSDFSDWTSWFMPAPTTSNSTHHQPATTTTPTLLHNNTSALTHATTMVPDLMSTSIVHVTSVVSEGPTETTGIASPSSTSGGSKNLPDLVLHLVSIPLVATLSFVI